MITDEFCMIDFDEDEITGTLSIALKINDNEGYMETLANKMIAKLISHMDEIHNEIDKYVRNEEIINDCKIVQRKDIEYECINTTRYVNDIKFINEHKNTPEGIETLKELLYSIAKCILITSTTSDSVYAVKCRNFASSMFVNKYVYLKEIDTFIDNIGNACTFNGSFTNYDFKTCVKCLRSTLKIYKILFNVNERVFKHNLEYTNIDNESFVINANT